MLLNRIMSKSKLTNRMQVGNGDLTFDPRKKFAQNKIKN